MTWRNPYQSERDELFASARSGKPTNNGRYMALSTMTGIMGQMATYTGKKIEWGARRGTRGTFSGRLSVTSPPNCLSNRVRTELIPFVFPV